MAKRQYLLCSFAGIQFLVAGRLSTLVSPALEFHSMGYSPPLGFLGSFPQDAHSFAGWKGRIYSLGLSFPQPRPLYFNLAVIPLMILLGFRSDRFTRSMVIVILASIWAGLSRINWFPLPGCLAALLYVLDIPYSGRFWSYFWRPIIWIVTGTFLGFAVSQGYNILSGNPEYYSNTIMNSSLLWYRLLPSVTFSMGVLLALLIAIGGLVVFIIWRLFASGQIYAWRKTATAAILLVFLLGGLVVSVKIGGGNNLHNLDAFLVLLLICAGIVFSGRITPDTGDILVGRVSIWLMAIIVGVPLIYQMPFLPFRSPEDSVTISQWEQVLTEKVLESPRLRENRFYSYHKLNFL